MGSPADLPPLRAEDGGDQALSDDPEVLRQEIYRLRDLIAEMEAAGGELQGLLSETQSSLWQAEGLGAAYDELHARHEALMGRLPIRIARKVRRQLRRLRPGR